MKNLILLLLLPLLLTKNLDAQKLKNREHLELLSTNLTTEISIPLDSAKKRVYGLWTKYGRPRIHSNPPGLNIRAFHVAFPVIRKRIFIKPGDLDDFVAEMAHVVQYKEQPIKDSFKKLGHLWNTGKRFLSYPRRGLQWAYDYGTYFEDVKDFEYRAHAIVEPGLRKELGMPMAFFRWKVRQVRQK